MRSAKILALPVIVVLGLLPTGVACWSKTLHISGAVNTGTLDWQFVGASCLDTSGKDYHCRDGFAGPPPLFWMGDKDVGSTTVGITDPHTVTVTMTNVYPSYFTSVSVYAQNTGSIPLIIENVVIDGKWILEAPATVRLDLDGDGDNDIEIWWGDAIGSQLHPGGYSQEMSFWVHVLQGAPMHATLSFTIGIIAVQYNESTHPPVLPRPTIGLTPTSLTFNAVGTNPPSQTVTVANIGAPGSWLNWSATDNAAWLSESPTSGHLASGASEPMTVSVDITGLAAGTYYATITVSDPNATNNPQTVSVTLVVPVTVNLHPDNALDTTDSPYYLKPSDLAKLATSDNDRYESKHDWKNNFDNNEYIEFSFPDIPTGATVDSVVLKFEWQRAGTVDNARLVIWDGSAWRAPYYLSLPAANTDNTVTIDLKAEYGIDTAAEVNALKVRFQATDGGGAKTKHDWVEVQVTYTP